MIPQNVRFEEPGIYRIINKVTWQSYYGRAVNLATRYEFDRDGYLVLDGRGSRRHHNEYLVNAWRKYGRENFVYEIVQLCGLANLETLEQDYLDRVVEWGFDYNMNRSARGAVLTPEQKQKSSEKLRAVMLRKLEDPDYVHPAKGKKRTEEQRRANSERQRARMHADDFVHPSKGRVTSQEQKDQISKANKGRKFSDESRGRLREAWERRRLKSAGK